jgi:hypothetical protein
MEQACAVADNRVSLIEAIRERAGGEQVVVRLDPAPPRRRFRGWVAGALGLVAVVLGLHAWLGADRAAAPARRTIGAAEVVTDARGRILRVSGPDPRSVVAAYSEAGPPPGRLEVVGVMPSARRSVRLGLLRDRSDRQSLLAITIREDSQADHWVAGDGATPLVAEPAPAGAAEAARAH